MLSTSSPARRGVHPLLQDAIGGKAPNLSHLGALCHHLGVVQFARGDTRDLESGFCVDDNARALIVAVGVLSLDPRSGEAHRIGEAALGMLERSHLPDGGFHNLYDENGEAIDACGRSEDADGRAIWALGITASRSNDDGWRARADKLLAASWKAVRRLEALRARAYVMLGAAAAARRSPQAKDIVERLGAALLDEFNAAASPDWPWWEPTLTWGNARVPEAMLRASDVTGNAALGTCGMRALAFLADATRERGVFAPVGNDGWYPRGGSCARYDQQPIEACAMVDAWLAAADHTGDAAYRQRALEPFAWFLGSNTERLIVADPQTGGCHDGIGRGWRNRNMGAESTLSYLAAHLAIATQMKESRAN